MAVFLKAEVGRSGRFSWALSGGSTPRVLFRHLAESYRDSIDWNRIDFYWGDERCVPPSDPESNFYWASKLLLNPLEIPSDRIHRILGEAEFPASEAERYSELIEELSLYRGGLNLLMLGMGDDGHTLSVFPGQESVWEEDAFSTLSGHPQTGQKRITLTERAVISSRCIAFLVIGDSKAEVLDELIHRKAGYDQYPASWITNLGKPIHWFLDRDAARYLEV